MAKKKRLLIVLVLFISNIIKVSAQNTVYFPQVFFDKKDAESRLNIGNSTIKGIAFTRQANAPIKTNKHLAKNTLVFLFPMTDYMEEWLKLYKSKGAMPNVKIVMSEESFKYHLETLTDEYGNFSFTKLKPGKYYIQCDIDFVGTDSYIVETGRTNYFNGYGYMGSTPIYENYFYNFNARNRESKIVEIESDGQLHEIKLKPELFENYAKIANKFISTTKCYQKNNLQFGECSEFYENGQIRAVSNWENGLLDGEVRYNFENGNIQSEGRFKKNFKIGDWKYYSEVKNGVLTTEERFIFKDKKLVKEGVFKYYYPSGKLKMVNNYENDLLQGTSFEYYESGKLKTKYDFKDSLYEGNTYFYDENENITETVTYKAGKEISKK